MCHGVLFKHLCSWLLYGYVYDPYKEFFIQPNEGGSHDLSHDQTSQSQEDEDDLGIMGVTGRQLQVSEKHFNISFPRSHYTFVILLLCSLISSLNVS